MKIKVKVSTIHKVWFNMLLHWECEMLSMPINKILRTCLEALSVNFSQSTMTEGWIIAENCAVFGCKERDER